MATKRAMLLLGRCIKASREEGVEVKVTARELDTYLNMFFPERYTFYAYDEKETCKPGDFVLIKKRDEPLTRKITHDISKIVYPYGDITDPITGKKVVIGRYRENIEELDRTFGSDGDGFVKYMDKQREIEQLGPAPPKPAPKFIRRRHRNVDNNPKEPEK